jgi:hypothetical protein
MKRKDMVTKLMTEGFTEKTLAGMTDKQLALLTGKILPEQTTLPGKVLIPQTSPTAQKDIATAKLQKKTIETYEGKEVDEEISEPKLGSESKPKSTEDKEAVIKRLKFKIKHEKDKKKVADAKKLLAKMTEKKPVNELKTLVNKIVESKIYPFTSKNEIMELIQVKLTEQRPQEAPHPADPDIDVEPGKREAPGIDPDDPFRDPHPGIDPNPKAKKKHKISAEDAKNKIIDLLKSEL